MDKFKKAFIKNLVKVILKVQAFLFRHKALNILGYILNHLMAWTTIIAKNLTKAETVGELGFKWQKGSPSMKQVPITGIDATTIHAEIHTECPLRGTGDVEACYKMMSFDRRIVKAAGGQFVVLQSQAQEGVHKCKVAMRFKGEDMSDLVPAYQKDVEEEVE